MHKGQALRVRQHVGVGAGLFQRVAVQHDLGAKTPRALHFHAGREARHHDDGAQAQALRVVGHALRVVAALMATTPRARSSAVSSVSLLQAPRSLNEGGELQVLELEEHLRAHDLRAFGIPHTACPAPGLVGAVRRPGCLEG